MRRTDAFKNLPQIHPPVARTIKHPGRRDPWRLWLDMTKRPQLGRGKSLPSIATPRWRAELLPKAPYEASYVASAPVIGFAFEAQSGTHAFAGDRRSRFSAKPNHLSFVPRGCDVYSQSAEGGEYLKVTLLDEAEMLTRSERRFTNLIDRVSVVAAEALRRRLLADPDRDLLDCERLVAMLTARARGVLDGRPTTDRAAAWMTSRRLKHVQGIVEQRLGERLTVGDLAESLGLSPSFFSRAFSAALGKPPHDYIIDRRLARARQLLSAGTDDIAGVAQLCGFSSHAHLSSVCRARLGVPPSRLAGR